MTIISVHHEKQALITVSILNRILREEFVRIYSEPVLQRFLDEQRRANPDIALPDCPKLGDLDIREVLASPYFFA